MKNSTLSSGQLSLSSLSMGTLTPILGMATKPGLDGLNGIDDICVDTLFSLSHNSNTRKADGKIFIQCCRTNTRKFSFSHRVAPLWNDLPTNIKFAQNTNKFKNLLDEHPKLKKLFYRIGEFN